MRALRDQSWASLRDDTRSLTHIIVIATKPDIIKQAPVYWELRRRGELVLICHTGQHTDRRYSGAMLEEFDLPVDIELNIRGPLHHKTAQTIERFGDVLEQLRDLGKTPIPYVHGDTAAAMAVGVASYLQRIACVHVEAGIRTLTPRREIYEKLLAEHRNGGLDIDAYRATLMQRESFERGSMEPYPEQFNTRVAEAATGVHAAPVELVRDFLHDEGFSPQSVVVTGNTVVDATRSALADSHRATIFDTYPQLSEGGFVRVCIHRRENTADRSRFVVLIDAIERLLESGTRILFISLFGTEEAIDRHDQRARLQRLVQSYPGSLIYSPVWPNYRDVIAAMRLCSAVATDSGSMQEEMSVLGIPCVTLRFGTDRPESVLAGVNLLAPPIDGSLVAAIIQGAVDNAEMASVGNIYGEGAAQRLVDAVLIRACEESGVFLDEVRRLAL